MRIGPAVIVFGVLVIAASVALGWNFNSTTEAAVDRAVERVIVESRLSKLKDEIAGGVPAAELAKFLEDPLEQRELQIRYKLLVGFWNRDVPHLRRMWLPTRAIDDDRLAYEFDERVGAGVFAMLKTNSANVDRQIAEIEEQRRAARRQMEANYRALSAYIEEHGGPPRHGWRYEDGKVVPLPPPQRR